MMTVAILGKRIALLAGLSVSLSAANFSFFTTMQAGLRGNGTGSFELGAGSTAATAESQAQYGWNPGAARPYWRGGNNPQSFQIGFDQSTNSGFVRVLNRNNNYVAASFANPGPALGTNTTWTIPTSSFFATASSNGSAASVSIQNLTISSGVQILSGSLPASIGASYTGSGPSVTNTLAAPIVINTASSGGSWVLSGTIRFNGFGTFANPNATGNQLGFNFGASGSDVASPESSSLFLIGAGLIALGCLHQRRNRPSSGLRKSV